MTEGSPESWVGFWNLTGKLVETLVESRQPGLVHGTVLTWVLCGADRELVQAHENFLCYLGGCSRF